MVPKRPKGSGISRPLAGQDNYRRTRGKVFLYQVFFSFLILLTVASVVESEHPWSKSFKAGAKALFTWELNYGSRLKTLATKALELWERFPGFNKSSENAQPAMRSAGKNRFLVIPVSGKILRRFGWQRDSLDGQERFHEGLDIRAEEGRPIKAALGGTVKKIGKDPVLGRYLIIEHDREFQTLYAHCSEILVEEDQAVRAGEVIAEVGSSGAVKEPQLHFEVREKGQLIDPLSKFNLHKQGV